MISATPLTPAAEATLNAPAASTGSRWQRWSGSSNTRKIFSAAVVVGLLTGIARIATVGKDLILAKAFGTGSSMDAFLVAFAVPFFIMGVISGSLNSAFIPTFVRVRDQEGREAAQELFSAVLFWTILLLAAATVLLAILGYPLLRLVGSGFTGEKLELTHRMFLVMLPAVAIYGAASLWSAVLNADHRFALPAVVPMITPLCIAFAVLADRGKSINVVAMGTLGGLLLEAAVTGVAAKRHDLRLLPRAVKVTPAVRQVLSQFLPMVAGAFTLSSATIVDQAMAASLGSGSVASLNYGGKIVTAVLNVSAVGLGTAALPYLSKMAAAGDAAGLRHTLRKLGMLIAAGSVLVTLVLCLTSSSLIRFVFERGNFTAADTALVSKVQIGFALQIPFYLGGTLLVRYFASANATRVMMWGAVLSFAANIVFNYVLMRPLGVVGIALSTSIVYLLSFAFLAFMLKRRGEKLA